MSTVANQLKALKIIKCSSTLMQYLNMSMLSLTLLKQEKLVVEPDEISNFHELLTEFTGLFEEHLLQKNLSLVVDKNI